MRGCVTAAPGIGAGDGDGDGAGALETAAAQMALSALQRRPDRQQLCPLSPQPVQRPSMQVPAGPMTVKQGLPAGRHRFETQQPPPAQAATANGPEQQGCRGPPQGRHTRAGGAPG